MASTMSQVTGFNLSEGQSRTLKGLKIERYFTRPGVDPYAEVEWEQRTASITNEKGKIVFEQANVEIPKTWSQMATNVVVSKYFRGPLGSPQREHSVRQMIGRVVDTITRWGRKDGYFASEEDAQSFHDELTHILVHQKACFNSPVWFNCGIEEKPQCSACFILSVDDTMESILDWYRKEGIIFKGGSGSGVNLSKIRSAKEQLAGGGTASGPVSFMKAADASAGVIKSGGKTTRTSKNLSSAKLKRRRRLGLSSRPDMTPAWMDLHTVAFSSKTPTIPCESPTSSWKLSKKTESGRLVT
jgi:ribonucleoside-diphosphate reductase alpha chain